MKQNEIGLVLYTVRDRAEKDFAGMMREVAAIGYGCAEVCGTFGLAAEQVRALGEETGLRMRPPSTTAPSASRPSSCRGCPRHTGATQKRG